MAFVHRLEQITPGFGWLKAMFAGFDRVVANRCDPGVHADPGRNGTAVDELFVQFFDALGLVGFEHAFALHQQQRSCRQAPDYIGLRVVFLGQQFGGYDTGGIPHPLDLDIGMILVEHFGVTREVFGFNRGVDGQLGSGERGLGRREPS